MQRSFAYFVFAKECERIVDNFSPVFTLTRWCRMAIDTCFMAEWRAMSDAVVQESDQGQKREMSSPRKGKKMHSAMSNLFAVFALLFHQRVPLIQAFILLTFPLLLLNEGMGELIGGAFDIRTWGGLFVVSMVCFLSAWTAWMLAYLVREGVNDRFGVEIPNWWDRKWVIWAKRIFWICVGAAIPVVCLWYAYAGDGLGWQWYMKIVGMLAGFLSGYLILVVLLLLFEKYLADDGDENRSRDVLRLPFARWQGKLAKTRDASHWDAGCWRMKIERMLARTFAFVGAGPGWLTPDRKRFMPSHRFAFSFGVVRLIISIVIGLLALLPDIDPKYEAMKFPTLVFLLFVITGVMQVLGLISFYLDRWKVPFLFVIFALIVIGGSIGLDKADYTFDTEKLDEKSEFKNPYQILQKRATLESDSRQLTGDDSEWVPVVICAEGGGIHAGAWTAHVLASLETLVENETGGKVKFSEQIVCCSGVSGGAYGLMYWADNYQPTNGEIGGIPQGTDVYRQTRGRAMRSSLNYAIRGTLYNDLIYKLVDTEKNLGLFWDRGRMLERAWQRDFPADGGENPMLSDWARDAEKGHRPVMLFNSTSVQTGKPVVFGTSLISNPESDDPDHKYDWHYQQHWRDRDVPVVSAVRCSSSFPYVTPAVRPKGVDENVMHLVDGGYFDNTGVVAMTRWLESALGLDMLDAARRAHKLPPLNRFPFDPNSVKHKGLKKIIVIKILEDPMYLTKEGSSLEEAGSGILFDAAAPVKTMLSVWEKGHRTYANGALYNLVKRAGREDIEIIEIEFVYPRASKPLSWHLSRNEMHEIARIGFTPEPVLHWKEHKKEGFHKDLSVENWSEFQGAAQSSDPSDVIGEYITKDDLQKNWERLKKHLLEKDNR